jgi:GDPmannose 4,6-dehydratase
VAFTYRKGIELKKAIITGITGQDGSYLAENLLDKGYEVHGIVRRVSTPNYKNIQHLLDEPNLHLEEGDITDLASLIRIFKRIQPDEIYNLAAQSYVAVSWDQPILTSNVTGMGALNVFEAARQVCKEARVYQASSSEMFDGINYPQTEQTPFKPRSPYGVSKLFAHEMARIYKESYGMFVSCGILFNHESPRRGIEFVTQKIVDTIVRQVCGEQITLELGNLEARRDWSHAEDMVQGMWLMLQNKEPDNYILSSGETHSIFEFVNIVYTHFGIDVIWVNKDGYPVGYDVDGKILVKSVDKYYRPNEVNILLGNPEKAKIELGWKPKYNFDMLVNDMIELKLIEYTKGG